MGVPARTPAVATQTRSVNRHSTWQSRKRYLRWEKIARNNNVGKLQQPDFINSLLSLLFSPLPAFSIAHWLDLARPTLIRLHSLAIPSRESSPVTKMLPALLWLVALLTSVQAQPARPACLVPGHSILYNPQASDLSRMHVSLPPVNSKPSVLQTRFHRSSIV